MMLGIQKLKIKTINDKKINFGDIRYQDWLSHKDKERRARFRARFNKLYEKNKLNYNTPIFWAYNLLW